MVYVRDVKQNLFLTRRKHYTLRASIVNMCCMHEFVHI